MNRHSLIFALLATILCITACTEEMVIYEQDASQCDAQAINVSGDDYCVYEGEVIVEEGFICPPDTPFLHESGGFGICSSTENEPTERIQEVVERYEGNIPDVNNSDNNQGEAFPALGSTCADAAPVLIDVEPIMDPEEWIVSFPDGTNVEAQADALADFYNFEVIEVFTIIPAFTAILDQSQLSAISCYEPVQSIEQSRSDIPPPTNDIAIDNFTGVCDEEAEPAPATLTLTDLGAGLVQVTHEHFTANCCSQPRPFVTVSEQRILIEYRGEDAACDCECNYTLDYTLRGLSDGLWTIDASPNIETVEVNVE